MSALNEPLNSTQLSAAAVEVLLGGGYVEATLDTSHGAGNQRVFEDAYGIVALTVFETWSQLKANWHIEQGALVDLMADNVRRGEPKAWEGYLVLLTPGLLAPDDQVVLNDLRNDTNRVRKIIATGDELEELSQVGDALLPLLPLKVDVSAPSRGTLLDRLPSVSGQGRSRSALGPARGVLIQRERVDRREVA